MKVSITVIRLLACGLICQCKNEATEIKSVGKVAIVSKEVTSENAEAAEDSSDNNANNNSYFESAGKPQPEVTATLEVTPEERPIEELQSPSPIAQPSQGPTPSAGPLASASATPSPSMTPSVQAQPVNPKVTLQSVCNNQQGFRLRFVEPFFASTVSAFRFTGCEILAARLNGQGFPKLTTVEALTGGQMVAASCQLNRLRLNIRQGFSSTLNIVTIESATSCMQIRNLINAAKI